jgi:type IV pilus assembly protein PilA
MMVVLGIIAILALMTLPMYIERNVQQQVKESIAFAEFMQRGVANAYTMTGVLPHENANASLPPPDKIIGNYVTAGIVADGAITLVFGNLAASGLKGKKVTLRPGYVPDAQQVPISWICGAARVPNGLTVAGVNNTDVPQEWLPAGCR